ncbi:UDP-N-acetyl-D-glucosamine 6-dehydrogenase [Fusarium oxysporum f. sp. rapae]|uniref:UDP-N-acetyl-D-glucosamine 6-dehydrogenase n=1 Tax=Fusarium oxysporum f. sp. rapae TaxID=485398 RepID=A0A8J5P0U5_FUSOX|nr:UDP-N-acetyl-D-glucosamine 6-dehydrogenase [Fusarium oxysporum f. sp. rapae]
MPHKIEQQGLEGNPVLAAKEDILVAVIGIGFVGTGLVSTFSNAYPVLGFDVSQKRVAEVAREFCTRPNARFTTQESDLGQATHFLISVPTLLLSDKSVDLSYIKSALAVIQRWAKPESTIVVESSVAVGMTRKLLGPLALSNGYFVGMSPERIDPGRTEPPMHSIPKVVSGLDDISPGSLSSITKLYRRVFGQVIPVSSPEVAEMTKLYENCQRMMGIAFANEMADACISHNINPFEVCRAASTKPFGYMPFSPSLGVGGHCIPVNPYYLLLNNDFPLLQEATERMHQRPMRIALRILDELHAEELQSDSGILVPKRVLIVGIGFKAGQSHLVNSPGLELASELQRLGQVDVMFADSLVRQSQVPHLKKLPEESWNEECLEDFDIIVVAFRQVAMELGVLENLRGVKVQMWCD